MKGILLDIFLVVFIFVALTFAVGFSNVTLLISLTIMISIVAIVWFRLLDRWMLKKISNRKQN